MDVGSRATHGAVAEVMFVNDYHLSPPPLILYAEELEEQQSKIWIKPIEKYTKQ